MNEEIKVFNNEMILKVCCELNLIEVEDYVKDKILGKFIRRSFYFIKIDVCLLFFILLVKGVRVMLIRNEDIFDGFVNGVMGIVMYISFELNLLFLDIIFIYFDNERIGINV